MGLAAHKTMKKMGRGHKKVIGSRVVLGMSATPGRDYLVSLVEYLNPSCQISVFKCTSSSLDPAPGTRTGRTYDAVKSSECGYTVYVL